MNRVQHHVSRVQHHVTKVQLHVSRMQHHMTKVQLHVSKMQHRVSKVKAAWRGQRTVWVGARIRDTVQCARRDCAQVNVPVTRWMTCGSTHMTSLILAVQILLILIVY